MFYDHQIEIEPGGIRLIGITRNGHSRNRDILQDIGSPTGYVNISADIYQEGRRRNINLAAPVPNGCTRLIG